MYRTKQIEVDARRLADGANDEVMAWCGGRPTHSIIEGRRFFVPKNGVAFVGDWVVRRGGAFLVLTDEAFRAAYEEVPAVAKAVAKPQATPAATPVSDTAVKS